MKEGLKRVVRWITTKGLVWFGFGATPFIFMACYGPVPTNYREVGFDDEIEEVADSTVDTFDMAGESVVVEDSSDANDQI